MTHCRRIELSFPTAAAFAIHNVRCLPGKGFHLFLVRAEGIRVRMHVTWRCTDVRAGQGDVVCQAAWGRSGGRE